MMGNDPSCANPELFLSPCWQLRRSPPPPVATIYDNGEPVGEILTPLAPSDVDHFEGSCVSRGAMVSNTPSRLISLWKRIAATCIRMTAKKAKAR